MAHISVSSPASSGIFARLAGVVSNIQSRYAQYRVYRNTLDELSALNDRELADLGLSRAMLRSVAYHSAYE